MAKETMRAFVFGLRLSIKLLATIRKTLPAYAAPFRTHVQPKGSRTPHRNPTSIVSPNREPTERAVRLMRCIALEPIERLVVMKTQTELQRIFLTRCDLKAIGVGVSNSTLLRWEELGRFPRRVRFSNIVVAWPRGLVMEWCEARISEREKEPPSS